MPSALKPSTTTSAGGDHGGGDEKSKDTPVAAKTIGFLVVFGIAASIAKALLTKPNPHPQRPRGPRMGFSNRAVSGDGWGDGPSSARTVVIAKGDTLWGLSKTYGVTVDAIREANGITGNKIYAGKKLIIP
ncbi:uncharacterized protein LOC135582552 isoform X2 [Musa acuminata AAA Group]|uniref:uncharacterized protein LOC135582552 isoform X2 n=1 Tax=Musa acuminata AAA Group TaxID=214697 RepID=UPI0031E0B101